MTTTNNNTNTMKTTLTAALIANADLLEKRHLIWAARTGKLLTILEAAADTVEGCLDEDGWAEVWEAHRKAGHPDPEYVHSAEIEEHNERGFVWGSDKLEAFGLEHTRCWCGGYGVLARSSGIGRRSDWQVVDDSQYCPSSPILIGMFMVYGIDMTKGQPPEPDRSECVPKETTTYWLVNEDGKITEAVVEHYVHPYAPTQRELESEQWLEDIAPLFPAFYLTPDGEEHDTLEEAEKHLSKEGKVFSDEYDARRFSAQILAERAVDEHGEPDWADLHRDDDDLPYLLPVGVEANGNHPLAYHLDEDDFRRVIAGGWAVLAPDVADAWGTRATIDGLREWQAEADRRIVEHGDQIMVSFADSIAAGNCPAGTAEFVRRNNLTGLTSLSARDLLTLCDNQWTRRAARVAAMRAV